MLDFAYFEKNYKIIAADLSKQKALDADSRAMQQIIFTGHTDAQIRFYYIFEQSKETILEFSKGKSFVNILFINFFHNYHTDYNYLFSL